MRFAALLERGNEHDISAWSERLLARVAKQVMRVNDKSVSVTCTIGLSIVSPGDTRLDALLADAMESARKGITRGGNQSIISDRADNDSRVMSYDQVWVKHIKAALMENRFRLVQQPIASLQGEDPRMFDVLVRMIDSQGKEVLPSEFMAAAGRNDLLKNIDRWVVGASLSFAAQKTPECLFVRLSRETARDGGFIEWLDHHLRSSRAQPQRLCFQVTEESAASHVPEVKALASALRERKFRFALEGFGSGRNSAGMLESVPLDFVKIDGTLVQGLAGDPRAAAARAPAGGSRAQEPYPDRGRARRGCQHHGGAVADRRAVHPGLLRQRARGSRPARLSARRAACRTRSSPPAPGRSAGTGSSPGTTGSRP